jgi:phosphatidate cytidylyltransferase
MAGANGVTARRLADPSANNGRRRGASELAKRVGSALIAAPVALAAVWFGSPWFELLLALVLAVGAHEWCRLCGLGWRAGGAAVWFAPLATLAVAAFAEPSMAIFMLLLGVGIAALQQAGGIASSPEPTGRWAAGGAALLGATAWSAMYLRIWVPDGALTIFWLFAVVWAADIGAYFTGRAIGGPKLAPRISPGKTWSGFAGGMILAVLIGGVGGWLKGGEWGVAAFLVALAVALASVFGDLLESWVKRRFGAKDSGSIMPGHGGVLDRIDGILTATPVLAIIAALASGDPVTWQ